MEGEGLFFLANMTGHRKRIAAVLTPQSSTANGAPSRQIDISVCDPLGEFKTAHHGSHRDGSHVSSATEEKLSAPVTLDSPTSLDGDRQVSPPQSSLTVVQTIQNPIRVSETYCTCIQCLRITQHDDYGDCCSSESHGRHICRIPGCSTVGHLGTIGFHEYSHLFNFRIGKDHVCPENDCEFKTKRWYDLVRHSNSKHCIEPKSMFACRHLSCKRSGNNGFARKDKLNDHYRTVHAEKKVPFKNTNKTPKTIMPKPHRAP